MAEEQKSNNSSNDKCYPQYNNTMTNTDNILYNNDNNGQSPSINKPLPPLNVSLINESNENNTSVTTSSNRDNVNKLEFKNAGLKILLKLLKGNKMGRLFLFIFFYFFILKIIDYIMIFFNFNREFVYTYFIWFSMLFLFFVLLPIKKSRI